LSKCQIKGESIARHLLCVVDSCTRIAWVESIPDKKALTVMFAVFRSFNNIAQRYNIRFAEVLTDNGPEFGPKESESKMDHPFERFLIEMGIKHRYTRPYRPQTNGKAERFWRSIEEDLLHEYVFESVEELEDELLKYVIYYNELRPHQGINGKTPLQLNEISPRIT
ncbi:integrase core domain-containing protein, partial [Geovibrio ferrireducens]|uniref:integrase core domain-containing protein n=1 Tax=Geovibrio ferrireducens TaxID=46201 RepID=UPI0022467477